MSPQDNSAVDDRNLFQKCLKCTLGNVLFAELYQVMQYVRREFIQDLYSSYNEKLMKNCELTANHVFPESYKTHTHVSYLIKYYSFRIIFDIGTIVIKQLREGDSKADRNLRTIIKVLIYHSLTSKNDTANLALVELEQLCKANRTTLLGLYQVNKIKFLKLIIRAILDKLMLNDAQVKGVKSSGPQSSGESRIETGDKSVNECYLASSVRRSNLVITYMTRAFELFNINSITSEDIAQSLTILTNFLVDEKYHSVIKTFLENLASYQNIDVCAMIKTHIQTIMVSLLLKGKLSQFDVTSSLRALCALCDKEPGEILINKLAHIKGQILLHYSTDPKRVIDAICYLSKFERSEVDQPFAEEFEDENVFVDYLYPSMVGILLGIDSYFRANARHLESEECLGHIESLTKYISKLKEDQVETIHHKILSTLSALSRLRPRRDCQLLNETLSRLWGVFLMKLDARLKNTLVITICVALIELLEDSPATAAVLYEDLISGFKTGDDTSKLQSLFFIPEMPNYNRVYQLLTPHVCRLTNYTELHELHSAIGSALYLMKQENQRCHLLAVKRLAELLRANQNLLISSMLVNTDEPVDRIISETIESLLALSSTQDQQCSAYIAECLGILGAVNPIRLGHLVYGEISDRRLRNCFISLDMQQFLVDLVERLKVSLFSDRRSESETANFALQVVIKMFNVHVNCKDELSEEAIRACRLCQNTSYMGTRRVYQDYSTPVFLRFKNECLYSYREWLDRFSLALISLLSDSKIQEMLHACTYVFKHNHKFAEYLLPIVVTHIILHESNKLDIIENEIMSVVNENSGSSTQDLQDENHDDFRNTIETLHLQCANMIFCILDVLNRLSIEFRSSERLKVLLKAEQIARLRDFIESFPKDKLAMLASRSQAYPRALYYFDQYFFKEQWSVEKNSTNRSDKYLTSLQKVLIALDDPHEAAGVDTIRRSANRINDDLANYESLGRFDKATTCYEALLDINDDHIDRESLIEDALRCLSNQGDNHRLYGKTRQLMSEFPKLRRNVIPAAVEACWKLSRWDELINMFSQDQFDSLLEKPSVCQGYLLTTLCESNQETIKKIDVVRIRLMRPLSIAIMDRSAYFRGYQNLLSLHIVEDFNLASECLRDENGLNQNGQQLDCQKSFLESKLATLHSKWTSRNKLVQPSIGSLEPLLAWQRSIYSKIKKKYSFANNLDFDIGQMWLKSSDLARETRCFDRSFYCLIQAQKAFGADFNDLSLDLRINYTIGHAKLDWDQGEQTKAIRGLKIGFERLHKHGLYLHLRDRREKLEALKIKTNPAHRDPFPTLPADSCESCQEFALTDKQSFAELKILLTRYSEEAAASMPETLLMMYDECVHLGVNQEETYLCLARYYDKLAAYYLDNPSAIGERICPPQNHAGDRRMSEKRLSDVGQRASHGGIQNDENEDICSKLMEQSVIAFGNSLRWGVRFLDESMPRMLNLWFELASKLPTQEYNSRHSSSPPTFRALSSRIENTIRLIKSLLSKKGGIPSYYFLTAISLLMSRVCHCHTGTSKALNEILERLLVDYPFQMMWLMIAMFNDENDRRKIAAKLIKDNARKIEALERKVFDKTSRDKRVGSPKLETIFDDYTNFSNIIIRLSKNHGPMDETRRNEKVKLTTFTDIKIIDNTLQNLKLSKFRIIAPVQASIRPSLPSDADAANLENYNVFPDHHVAYVREFDPKVRVFNSLQQPRQVIIKCSNGQKMNFICKYGDDLRKDSRCVEFFNLVNRVLRKNNRSSARFFDISTFLVLPLNKVAGIIEMVPNCETVRSLIERLYRERNNEKFNIHDGILKRQRLSDHPNDAVYRAHVTKALPKVSPPVLNTFFLFKFSEPTSWYMARLAYIRSTAVISMGGYIIGLGDRHLDNILLNVCTGGIVHVDFNLLFHQALTLPVPEVVPFRLTPNIVAPFGPMRQEGNFRKLCELAMQVMRKEKEALITTLKPFTHDPCTEWVKERPGDKNAKEIAVRTVQQGNMSAKVRIEVVERKLKGFPGSMEHKPLTISNPYSVEAQVESLLEESLDVYNQSQMYHGWCPHL